MLSIYSLENLICGITVLWNIVPQFGLEIKAVRTYIKRVRARYFRIFEYFLYDTKTSRIMITAVISSSQKMEDNPRSIFAEDAIAPRSAPILIVLVITNRETAIYNTCLLYTSPS